MESNGEIELVTDISFFKKPEEGQYNPMTNAESVLILIMTHWVALN